MKTKETDSVKKSSQTGGGHCNKFGKLHSSLTGDINTFNFKMKVTGQGRI
jgi:hypothetical protein